MKKRQRDGKVKRNCCATVTLEREGPSSRVCPHVQRQVTTHYSQAELGNLLDAANKVCPDEWNKNGTMVLIKEKTAQAPQKQLGGFSMKSVVGATGFEPATT